MYQITLLVLTHDGFINLLKYLCLILSTWYTCTCSLTSFNVASQFFSNSNVCCSGSGKFMCWMIPSLPNVSSPSNGLTLQNTLIFP